MRRSISVSPVPELGLPNGFPVQWGLRYVPRKFTIRVSEIVPKDVYMRDGHIVGFVEHAHQRLAPEESARLAIKQRDAEIPRYELDVEMIEGQPRCQGIRSSDKYAGLTTSFLRRIPVEGLVMQATALISKTTANLDSAEPITTADVDDAAASYKRPREAQRTAAPAARRKPVTAERLREAAEAHRAGGIPEIERRLNIGRVHAHRLRNLALEAGEDVTPPRSHLRVEPPRSTIS